MGKLRWTGRLSPEMALLVNLNNVLAWIGGAARDSEAMKLRMRQGYEGACSDDVTQYDDLAIDHYSKISRELLDGVDLHGSAVLDVGCGTGILSLCALQGGAASVTCGDASGYMLSQCEAKLSRLGFGTGRAEMRQLDAESLPFGDGVFDATVSAMLLGLVPDQERVAAEMVRVIRPGGAMALATHGPECWWEAADAEFRSLPKRYLLAYRAEYWPLREDEIRAMLERLGLADVRTRRIVWQDRFPTGGEAYDFFAAASASWWLTRIPPHARAKVARESRDYFQRGRVDRITHDIILAHGRKR